MGTYADQLKAIAAATPGDDPTPGLVETITDDLDRGSRQFEYAAEYPGLKGLAATQETELLTEHRELTRANSETIRRISDATSAARAAMAEAAAAYGRLPNDRIPGWVATVIKTGGSVFMGPLGDVATEKGLEYAQRILSSAREEAAKRIVLELEGCLTAQAGRLQEISGQLEPPTIQGDGKMEYKPPRFDPPDLDNVDGGRTGPGTRPGPGIDAGQAAPDPTAEWPGTNDGDVAPSDPGTPHAPTPEYPVPPVFPHPPGWLDPVVPGGPEAPEGPGGGGGDNTVPPSGPPYRWDPPGYTPPSVDGGGGLSGIDPLGGGMTGAGLLAGGALGARALGSARLGASSAWGSTSVSPGAATSSGLFGSGSAAAGRAASSSGATGTLGAIGSSSASGTSVGGAGSSGAAGRAGGMMGGGMGSGGSSEKKRAGGSRYVAARIEDDTPERRGPLPGAEASSRAELAKKAPRRPPVDTTRLT